MSGFDPAWLDLREPADHRARSAALFDAVARAFGGRETITVADLASGSGSTLRALAPRLGPRQRWLLFDHDVALLKHAQARLAGWATSSRMAEDALLLEIDGAEISVETIAADLAAEPLPAAAAGADLVTASALFDLVGPDWLDDFVRRLGAAKRPLYAALTYDGHKRFSPPHPADEAVVSAFNRHQRSDKGFGLALGPDAAAALAGRLEAAGYACLSAPSPWRLEPPDAALSRALIAGVAEAAAEAGEPGSTGWANDRIGGLQRLSVEVGHADLLALPRS